MTTPPPDTQPAAETLEEIAEKVVAEWDREVYQDQALIDAITSALRNERERCAKVADRWANSHSCDVHDDSPCCHIRTGAAIAAAIREGK